VIGKPMAELIIPPRLRELHHRGLARYLATGAGPMLGKRIEMPALRRDGTEIPVEVSINAIQLENRKAFTATLRDITERKKTEAALEGAQAKLKAHAEDLEKTVAERTHELRETIAEIESFSYSISHDMRGPLRAMQGYASVLEEELKGKIGAEEWGYLGRIVAAAAHLNKLVQDILSYSQVSRTRLQLSAIDLQPLLLELIQQNPNLQPPLAQIRIEGPLPIVSGHETALTQICANLLGNAVKFVFPGTTALVRVWAETHEERVRIWIADNGIGIEPKNQERIFQMFERINSTKDYEGTGIGLAIVKKAVERMGGQIGVESDLGKGARFWFELRCAAGV
ncbi:MAG TPA: ATP-binding protein, partial [Methylomirabilota bacterium]|nr:ATP-binding protein [Methylomirabilota bacterium]